MNQEKSYDQYPIKFVLGSSIIQILIYIFGAYLVYLLGPFWVILYVLYLIILEIRLLKTGCIHCYYYNKRCAFGKGKFCALFFKKGNPDTFVKKQFTWLDIVPDFLVSIIPLVIGIIYLFSSFSWSLLFIVVALVILSFPVTGFLRGSLACSFCKQREIGCPAEQLFKKKQSGKTYKK